MCSLVHSCTIHNSCAHCTAAPNCSAFTYHPAGGHSARVCSLWTLPGQPHHSDGAISASSVPIPGPGPAPSPPTPPATLPPIPPVHPPLGFKPNIVLIMTDDQDVELDSLDAMPKLRSLVGNVGATHRHWYVCEPGETDVPSNSRRL